MSKALYRKYRSKNLSEVVGQRHITDILSRALAEGKISHAYLFTGPRGVGKTSIARIVAHEINKLPYTGDNEHLDIIEIDAASNNGVEDIRDLRERVRLAPVSAEKKVYIIDEVHMLSKAAFNALLKTLEEPPVHVVFILATTDADKLPDTIISRTQRFNFRTVPVNEVADHLMTIVKSEGYTADPEGLTLIAEHGEGSFRDSISLLDQLCSAADKKTGITKELVETFLGLPPRDVIDGLLKAHEQNDIKTIVSLLDETKKRAAQPTVIASELIRVIQSSIVEKPQFLPLLDELLEVQKSVRPDIKLLTVLGLPNNPQTPLESAKKPKTLALTSSTPTVEKPIESIKKENKKAPEEQPTPPPKKPVKKAIALEKVADLDWSALLSHIKATEIALNSVLIKCTPHIEDNLLTIYCVNAFYKKKLDSTKYRLILVEALEELGVTGLTIETIGSPPPPKDDTAASVAAIMGGGEEYTMKDEEA